MKAVVIGAGVGGMAAAYDLSLGGADVTILEAEDQVGGLASGFKQPGWDWSVERYYHHWFASDRHMMGLIQELGWQERVIFPHPTTVVFHEGEFYALDSPLNVLRFPAISLAERLRMGLVIAYLRYLADWRPLEGTTAHDWLRRWLGQRTYEIVWEPLLVGKFGPHYRKVNMAWFWARIKARTPRLGTFEGGFQAFMDSFASLLKDRGVALRLNIRAERIETAAEGLRILTTGGALHADHCLVTSSPRALANMAPDLPAAYLEKLHALRSMGAVVLVLALRERLSQKGFYWHNLPKAAGFPFLSLVEHTNFIPAEKFGGDHIVYLGDYLEPDHEYFHLSREQLLERFLPSLKRFNPRFEPEWVKGSWLFRTAYAQPVPGLHHSKAIPDVRTPIPGLWFASMSQVYPWDRGTNFAVEIARRTARQMLHQDGLG